MTRLVMAVCVVLVAGLAHAGELATDSKYGITLRVPDGFRTFPEGMAQRRAIFSYARGEPGEPGFEVLGVTALGGTIGREAFDTRPIVQGLAAAMGLTVVSSAQRPLAWKGFELDAFTATLRKDDVTATIAGVQVPVRGEAVQIMIMRLGDKDVGDELQAVLAGFEAESNWLTNDERIGKLLVGGASLLACVIAYVVFRRRRRRTERGDRPARRGGSGQATSG
ncbi:MAG: hypothetical protein JNL83_26045 [Myxococcales bacterium]|nr:hypothetical protein [Myxococcales bacterium]